MKKRSEASSGVLAEIRAEMARQQVKQVRVASELGVSPGQMSKKLSGASPLLAADVEQIAGILGVTVGYLYGEIAVH